LISSEKGFWQLKAKESILCRQSVLSDESHFKAPTIATLTFLATPPPVSSKLQAISNSF
jgi:hypothetical protein